MISKTTVVSMLDTETTNDIGCPIVYDVGYQIFTLENGLLCEKSFVNADVFLDKDLMASAYFADKIPAYWEDIKSGKRILKRWKNIKREIQDDFKKFGVSIVCAHNARFDNKSLNTTQRYITSSKNRYFLPYGVEWWDTLKMAREILKNNDDYSEFCYENEYLTARGCRRYTAEVIYKWLTKNNDFVESHTGLEDVKIERAIFEYLIQQNPEINGKLWSD